MWAPSFINRKTDLCEHLDATVTTSYGLQRTVCSGCGNVRVGYLFDFIEYLATNKTPAEMNVTLETATADQGV